MGAFQVIRPAMLGILNPAGALKAVVFPPLPELAFAACPVFRVDAFLFLKASLLLMNKTELVKKVAAENELTQKAAVAVVDSVLNSVIDSLAAREPVSLFGFGTFSCKHRDERTGRNPATGEVMTFAASNTPVFKPAKAFKEKVN